MTKMIVGKESFTEENAEQVAKSLKASVKGVGTDEKRIIREMLLHTNDQRQLIQKKYKAMYGHTLEEDLKSDLSGKFEDVVIGLLKPTYEYEAEWLKKSIEGFGIKTHVVIDILCTKEGPELQKLNDTYRELYKSNLDEDIKGKESGPLNRLFISLATGNRPSGDQVDHALAVKEARELYDATEGKTLSTEKIEIVRILATRSFQQLRETFNEYYKLAGKDIEKTIKSETSGDFEDALVAIIESIRNRPAYFAKRLNESLKSLITKDQHIIRIIVSRSEIDIVDIRREYLKIFGHTLYDDLRKRLTGDYEDIILCLVGRD